MCLILEPPLALAPLRLLPQLIHPPLELVVLPREVLMIRQKPTTLGCDNKPLAHRRLRGAPVVEDLREPSTLEREAQYEK